MSQTPGPEGQSLSPAEEFDRFGLDSFQVWVEYRSMTGVEDLARVRAVLRGWGGLAPYEHNKLAAALNEHFVEAGQNHPVAYLEPPDIDFPAPWTA